jgi:CDP-diacylglycerol---serine O-phosphatidyltransferase
MNIKKNIPNLITLLNLFCGCVALVFISNNQFLMALYFVCLGIFLDFFDGFFARLFKVSSPLGLQLDSLADMVTSGVVPGYAMYKLMSTSTIVNQLDNVISCFPSYDSMNNPTAIFPYLGFIITLGACYRLANFNIDTRQTDSFIGLPTPANALFILSLPLILLENNLGMLSYLLTNRYFLLAITLLSAFLMNAEIPLFSLKIKDFSIKKNALQIFFLVSSVLFLIFFRYLGMALIILFYVLLSIINNFFAKKI